jgi:hypothetical protein
MRLAIGAQGRPEQGDDWLAAGRFEVDQLCSRFGADLCIGVALSARPRKDHVGLKRVEHNRTAEIDERQGANTTKGPCPPGSHSARGILFSPFRL